MLGSGADRCNRIAFSGLETSGQSDLYVMDRATEALTRLTNDYYADSDPTWSPDGSQIAFASDRTRYGKDGHQNLFLLDMSTLEIRYLTCGPWVDSTRRARSDLSSRRSVARS